MIVDHLGSAGAQLSRVDHLFQRRESDVDLRRTASTQR
jgi:hypothetical protein